MDQEVKALWVKALRSKEYKQSKGQLKTLDGGYCCLGVAAEEAVKADVIPPGEFDNGFCYYGSGRHNSAIDLPPDVRQWLGLTDADPYVTVYGQRAALSHLNDTGHTFDQIADIIEEQL